MSPPGEGARRWFLGRRAAATVGWRRTDALVRAVACGFGLVVVGVVLHHLELLLVGVPLLVSAMLVTPPAGQPKVTATRLAGAAEPGGTDRASVSVAPGDGAAFLALRMPLPSSGRGTGSGVGPVHLLPAVSGEVRTTIEWHTWGLRAYLRPDHLLAGDDALYVYGPVVGRTATRTVLPPVEPLPLAPLPPRAAGLVGAHRSARAGDGMELRDIRPFQPGDRLRRVDWRVSLRAAAARGGALTPGALHVRERHAETDADLLLALDTTLDVGPRIAGWSVGSSPGSAEPRSGGSLDVGVRAVTSLAAAFLRHGDRVGLVDLGHPRGGVPPGSGRRQLARIRHQLVLAAQRVADAEPTLRAGQVPAGATVVVLSPFLADAVVDLAVRAARRGSLVLAVDLLPAELAPDRSTPWGGAVRGILVAEHRLRLEVLAEHGVPVTRWQGAAVAASLRAARLRRRGAHR